MKESELKELELLLLKMWEETGIKEIYKYKHRIKHFREPLTNIELFLDMTYCLFQDVEDIANHRDSCPEDYKVTVASLIEARNNK